MFLWFKEDVIHRERKRVRTDIQQLLNARPVMTHGCSVRATLEIERVKRFQNKAQVIFLGTMRDMASLGRDAFDISWVSTGIRVAANSARVVSLVAVATIGIDHDLGNCVVNMERMNISAPGVDFQLLQTCLEDM